MTSTVLVTGGAGFIGTTLARRLVETGHRVVAVDSLHPQVHPEPTRPASLPAQVDLLPLDVTQAETWATVLGAVRPDVVVHLAAETGTGQSLSEASRHGMVNVVGTTRMLDALLAADAVPAHLVLASSRAVYGEGAWRSADGSTFYPEPRTHDDLVAQRWDPCGPDGLPGRPLPSRADRTPARPTNIYAATKLAQEHLLSAWSAATGSALSILRLQNVYGPGQSLTNSYTGILALFARLSLAGQAIDVYEDGHIVRDFVHVDDVAMALTQAIARPPTRARLLDVGSGVATTVHEVARTMAASAGAPPPVVSGRFRDGDVRAASCELDATTSALGYRPAWTLEAGLSDLLAWAALA